jgi:hypothetical protein
MLCSKVPHHLPCLTAPVTSPVALNIARQIVHYIPQNRKDHNTSLVHNLTSAKRLYNFKRTANSAPTQVGSGYLLQAVVHEEDLLTN